MIANVEFRLVPHSVRRVNVVEVWRDGVFIATITPGWDISEGTLRIVTKHPIDAQPRPKDATNLNVMTVTITPQQ